MRTTILRNNDDRKIELVTDRVRESIKKDTAKTHSHTRTIREMHICFTRKKRNEINVNDTLLAMRNCHSIRTFVHIHTHTQQTNMKEKKL